MIDVLIDGLVVDGLSWMVDPNPPGDLLWGPSLSKGVFHIPADEIILQPLMLIGLRLSLTSSSVRPTGNIASSSGGEFRLSSREIVLLSRPTAFAMSPRLEPSES